MPEERLTRTDAEQAGKLADFLDHHGPPGGDRQRCGCGGASAKPSGMCPCPCHDALWLGAFEEAMDGLADELGMVDE